ncbi:MAG: DUF1330 domain-containing protein [Rhodovibrionaceae bacterium]|nr:DUF1330 domain-containing protein [Rhodovibrionaceae bacterium]
MAAYIVAHVKITDPETYERYRARTPDVVAAYGGRFVIRGSEPEVLEGAWAVQRLVVIEFPDKAAARRFYESPEYQEIVDLRRQASEGTLAIFEGGPQS